MIVMQVLLFQTSTTYPLNNITFFRVDYLETEVIIFNLKKTKQIIIWSIPKLDSFQ